MDGFSSKTCKVVESRFLIGSFWGFLWFGKLTINPEPVEGLFINTLSEVGS